ncbi:hypothetical protein V8E36_009118 [Tilletia maclaganii]
MKKFFSRFSTGPTQQAASTPSPSTPSSPTSPATPRNREESAQSNASGNVRSLAARFESLQPQRQQQQQQSAPTSLGGLPSPSATTTSSSNNLLAVSSTQELLTPSPSIAPALQTITNLNPPPAPSKEKGRAGQDQQQQNLPSVIVNGGPGGTRRTKEARDASGGSSAANSSTASNPAPTKSVAFAPSPKKAVRSPLLLESGNGGPTASSSNGGGTPQSTFSFPSGPSGGSSGHGGGGGANGGNSSGMVSDGSDTDLRSFAKPTAASLARAFRSASPQLSTASGASTLYSKRISLPGRSFIGDGKEGSVSWHSSGARSLGGPSWSEMTEDDLVANLGPRERTRQEVLWEIVASEERYVNELQHTRLYYLEALLHPHRFSTKELPPPPAPSAAETFSPSKVSETVPEHPVELPIAARWMTTATTSPPIGGPSSSAAGTQAGTRQGPPSTAAIIQSSYRPLPGRRSSTGSPRMGTGGLPPASGTSGRTASGGSASGKPTRSATYDSLTGGGAPSSHPLSRSEDLSRKKSGGAAAGPHGKNNKRDPSSSQSRGVSKRSAAAAAALMKGKLPMFPTFPGSSQGRGAPDPLEVLLPVSLPTSVRIVLETISEGLLNEHNQLSDALKNRYQEQWPLVRSLADVFLKHSFLLKHYAVYVCHLERALEYLEEAALMERAMRGKRIRKEKMTQTVAVGRAVAALEAIAAERNEPGLALFISKPFQRLLKYPLLFQNLLFHTDPSTYEFESTVAMVVEVERIVRSIEDEKVSAEERDRSRDAFARIDGITDRAVLKPKPDRTLIEEKPLYDEGPKRALSESRTENVSQTEAQTSELSSGPRASTTGRPSGGGASGAGAGTNDSSLRALLKSKRSFRRLSDFMHADGKSGGSSSAAGAEGSPGGSPGPSAQTKAPNLGSKRDLWVIRFSDVELRCQRTGTTTLPMVSSAALRPEGSGPAGSSGAGGGGGAHANGGVPYAEDEQPDFASRSQYSKERLRALRNTTLRAKTRNLYKFIAVQSWKNAAPSAAAAAMAARRAEGLARAIQEVEVEDDEEEDEDGSDGLEEGDEDEEDGPTESDSSEDEGGGYAGGGAGSANPDRFVREAKLSFSYWGDDRVEPRPSATYSSTSKSPHLSSVAAFRQVMQNAASQNNSSPATPDGVAAPGGGSLNLLAGRGDLSHLGASGSTPNLRSLSPSKRLAAENVVAGSHAGPRVQKFANRLRTVPPTSSQQYDRSESAPSSAHGHGSHHHHNHHHHHHHDSSGSAGVAEPGPRTGRISGTYHAQFSGGRASTVGAASVKSGRVSNGTYR